MEYGFVKVAAIVPKLSIGNPQRNAESIIAAIEKCEKGTEIILLPELCLSSSSCTDLFMLPLLTAECEKALEKIAESTKTAGQIIVIGTPVRHRNSLFNCMAVIYRGEIKCLVPKKSHSNRQFADGALICNSETITISGKQVPFVTDGTITTPSFTLGIEIGEEADAPLPYSARQAMNGAHIILNPSSRTEGAGSHKLLKERIKQQSRRCKCVYIYAASGWGESTSNAVHGGYCAIAECGKIIAESNRFITESHILTTEADVEKTMNRRLGDNNFAGMPQNEPFRICTTAEASATFCRKFNPTPFIPTKDERHDRYEEIFTIQATALARRMEHTCSRSAVIGVSGGLDSTLALLVTAKALDILKRPHNDIIAITMPGFGTTDRTYRNALCLIEKLGATMMEISIKDACIQHFKDIDHDISNHDTTYENSQARERTQILMDIANKMNGMVIGTGDMSELALGWATYNGDHMSMYGVNASVPKTLIQHIVRWVAENCGDNATKSTLLDILDTPISPELTPADDNGNIKQKTEDLVGPYELHDFFLYHFIRNRFSPEKIYFMAQRAFEGTHSDETIRKWLKTFIRRFFTQQFKRSCMPDGPKTGNCNLNHTYGWDMPADCSHELWSGHCCME